MAVGFVKEGGRCQSNCVLRATCPIWAMYLYTIRINNIKMVQTRTYTQESYNDVVFVFCISAAT